MLIKRDVESHKATGVIFCCCLLCMQTQQSTNNGQALARAAANAIMSAALELGSTDNITVVAILLDWDCEYSID